ncbi:glycosyltransferase [Lactococcus lactis]|uniref:glycosyltransferase n=1 Tax=Lactococcus lactis TaxID=1358 RepID=UPI0024186FAE|nr:glycosyltransferase [Lactococcus lactis]MDG4963615.1 glycosyltransferase [Lactococcus lactis]
MNNKKKVVILLSTYRPNMVFFEKLLTSLNQQDYSNLELYIRDDSADKEWSSEIKLMVSTVITKITFHFEENEINLGSNRTFELLTKECIGDYLAYCDQDDIWEPYKISKLIYEIEKEDAEMCYSDLSLIDESDKKIANSFREIKKRVVHVSGEHLFDYFLRRSSVTGCTMLVKADTAKKSLPFPIDYMVHDQWITLFCASKGKIAYVSDPLIRYRLYSGNQIGASVLPNIFSKQDYLKDRLFKEVDKLTFLENNYKFSIDNEKMIQRELLFFKDRILFFERTSLFNLLNILKYLKKDTQLIIFEIFIAMMPKWMVSKLFSKLHHNKVGV